MQSEFLDPPLSRRFERVAPLLWGNLLRLIDRKVKAGELIPRHGPGSTSDSLRGNAKWRQKVWPERLEEEFPSVDFLLPNSRYFSYLDDVQFTEPGAELPVKVALVPKTPKTPRIIAIEPACMMYAQQSLYAVISDSVEEDDFSRQVISWRSEVPNQHLARIGSSDGSFATLDLKEASDRVSVAHVRALLGRHKQLYAAVMACRSSKARVPGRGLVPLSKYASMGSALTFPLEALVFTTIVFCGIESALNRPLTPKDVQVLKSQVRIYGDDIVVPVEFVTAVHSALEDFGFLVNSGKSFWTGKFRESCGGEFYSGIDVSIVKIRRVLPTDRTQVSEIESGVALRNLLYLNGYWESTAYVDGLMKGLIPFPRVAETSRVLGRLSFLGYDTQRIDKDLHSPLVKGAVSVKLIPPSPLDDAPALLKVFTTSGVLPNPDVKHLKLAGRPRKSHIKTGWYSPF
jgi:hypothetical protein